MTAGNLIPHIMPEPFDQIQIGAVGRQRHQTEPVFVCAQERIQLRSDMR